MTDPFTLAAEALELELAPAVGGSIARFDYVDSNGRRTPVLRPSATPLASPLEASSFPLVPYVNRIRGGEFEFRGRKVRIETNMAGDPSPLHGQGWLGAWQVERASGSEAELVFVHDAGEWPWPYESRQHFALDAAGLETRISCRNTGDDPMPCGLGIHPYFQCGAGTRIRTGVEHVWTVDEQVLPVEKVAATGRYDIADSPVCGRGLDNGYGGWNGTALLSDSDWPFDIVLSSPGARFFQLYSPEAGGIFVAEPVSHANDALSAPEADWADLGIRVLEPGESMELGARLEVRAKKPRVG